MSDKNIIYVEKESWGPYVFLCGQMLRNIVVAIDQDNNDYQELSKGKVWAIFEDHIPKLIKDVQRIGIDFEVRYVEAQNFRAECRKNIEAGIA